MIYQTRTGHSTTRLYEQIIMNTISATTISLLISLCYPTLNHFVQWLINLCTHVGLLSNTGTPKKRHCRVSLVWDCLNSLRRKNKKWKNRFAMNDDFTQIRPIRGFGCSTLKGHSKMAAFLCLQSGTHHTTCRPTSCLVATLTLVLPSPFGPALPELSTEDKLYRAMRGSCDSATLITAVSKTRLLSGCEGPVDTIWGALKVHVRAGDQQASLLPSCVFTSLRKREWYFSNLD